MLHLIQRMTSVKPGSAFYERALVHKSDCIYARDICDIQDLLGYLLSGWLYTAELV